MSGRLKYTGKAPWYVKRAKLDEHGNVHYRYRTFYKAAIKLGIVKDKNNV